MLHDDIIDMLIDERRHDLYPAKNRKLYKKICFSLLDTESD